MADIPEHQQAIFTYSHVSPIQCVYTASVGNLLGIGITRPWKSD